VQPVAQERALKKRDLMRGSRFFGNKKPKFKPFSISVNATLGDITISSVIAEELCSLTGVDVIEVINNNNLNLTFTYTNGTDLYGYTGNYSVTYTGDECGRTATVNKPIIESFITITGENYSQMVNLRNARLTITATCTSGTFTSDATSFTIN
jgi:hypothetical protein